MFRPMMQTRYAVLIVVVGLLACGGATTPTPSASTVKPLVDGPPTVTVAPTIAVKVTSQPSPLPPTLAPTQASTVAPKPAAPTAVPPTPLPPTQPPAKPAAKPGVKPTGNACPAGYPVKGNRTGKDWIYHVPGGRSYAATNPEECFATAADAAAAGYRAAQN